MSLVNKARRPRGIGRPRVAGLMLFALALPVAQARAQQQIVQDGQLFDANPSLLEGRYNYARPVSPLLGGNPYATGNIGRGMSLRSFAPIGSPTAFRADLGSAALSNFIRDSISTGSAYSLDGGLSPTPFFDPVRTAPTASYLRGFSDFRPATPGQDLTAPVADTGWQFRELPQYGAPPKQAQPYYTPREFSSQYLGQPLNLQLSSGIFGPEQPRLPGPLSDARVRPNPSYVLTPEPSPLAVDSTETSEDQVLDPLDLRVWPKPLADTATPLDVLMRENAARLATEPTLPPQQPGALFTTPTAQLPSEPGVDGMAAGPVSLPGLSLQPGGDVFTDMQLALELSRNPQPEWYSEIFTPPGTEVAEAPTEDPTLSLERQARAAQSAEQFLTRMFEAPLQTFVGDSATAVNHELRQAEAALSLGRYYDAVRHYERVCVLDPANPLPLIGKGHALLAAGEYVSAAVSLIAGLERFPDLARFHEDLAALMGGGEIVDIRRAGLMRQLERNEDPQLRFLLGYLEVHSNLVEFGMQNLEKAAREAEPGSLIRRYPDMIRHKVWLSPELPSDEIDRPAPPDSGSPATEPTISEEGAR